MDMQIFSVWGRWSYLCGSGLDRLEVVMLSWKYPISSMLDAVGFTDCSLIETGLRKYTSSLLKHRLYCFDFQSTRSFSQHRSWLTSVERHCSDNSRLLGACLALKYSFTKGRQQSGRSLGSILELMRGVLDSRKGSHRRHIHGVGIRYHYDQSRAVSPV